MENTFVHLAVILFVAFMISYLVRSLKQPVIIGYILAGIIVSPFLIKAGAAAEITDIFSKIGIALLLFMVGLHLNPKIIREIGTKSLLIGLAQIIITFGFTFAVSSVFLGFDAISSAYIGIAIAFSSTIIIMKILSDKRQLDSLHGKLSIGILIIQDLAAIIILIVISSAGKSFDLGYPAFKTILVGAALILGFFLAGFFILPKLTKNIAKSQELLFLFSICWCFLAAGLFAYFGFSIEIGALIAGMILSISPYSIEISSKIRPLRDFFLIIFFMVLGLSIDLSNIQSVIVNAIILSLIVLIIKPVILMTFMALFKYTKKTNFLVGTSLAQISEFSLIILVLGVSLGHISGKVLSTITLALVITIFASTYMIIYSKKFYKSMSGIVSVFERKNIKTEKHANKKYNAVLFGYNRTGFNILNSLSKLKKSYLVVDFNPDTISNLNKFRIPCIYGDADDAEFLNELPLSKAELIISTIPDFEINLLLIEHARSANPDGIIISRASSINDALELYKKGASYVLTPHFIGGEHLANMIENIKTNKKEYEKEKEKHIQILKEVFKTSKGKLRIDSHSNNFS